jgi:putative lipoprotein
MQRSIRNSLIILFCTTIGLGCGGSKNTMNKYYGKWKVINAYGKDFMAANANIEFRGRGTLFGFGGCNTYSGSYVLNEEKRTLTFGPLMATKKYCQGIGSDCESQLFRALNNATKYLAKTEGIYIQNDRGDNFAFIVKSKEN